MKPSDLKSGDRVRVKAGCEIDKYPFFKVKEGATGVVRSIDTQPNLETIVWVTMDETIEGCEEWDNEVALSEEDEIEAIELIEH